ncbi:MAG TPA: phenylalanine--tRNA ligase subunit beta [Candidatus Nitrosotenuis sp.]|jgi:phenylalanyl-tRNA synthetase beta chain|nr:phenylalanine--tRNA ligase subunit beta [Candidatus Nitrosotenuis sp.]
MPVVTLYLHRLEKLVGKTNRSKIIKALPFLGLDIEEETKEYVKVEYSPNRPDYATDVGIAAGLQGLFGIKKGTEKIVIKKSDKYCYIKTEPQVKKIRPYVCAIVAKRGKLDDEAIKQLIALQEDLHFGIGRRRKKASVGIHDLDKLALPLTYTAVAKNHSFIPLNMTENMSVERILANTEVGTTYGRLLHEYDKVPVIIDAKNNTISLPPIINSALTTVTTKTANLLVEVTGTDKNTTEDTLAVVATTLQGLGFTLYDFKTDSGVASKIFKTKSMQLDASLVNQTLGVTMTPAAICNYLKKSRIDARASGKKIFCKIPRFRFDIFGPMDLVEEVALGYGIQNLVPTLPTSASVGQKHAITKRLDHLSQIMIGLGFTEALNSSLTSKHVLYDETKRTGDVIEVAESKSQEYTILRDSLLPGLLENLSRNIHESYPQRLFEIGTIFSADSPIKESISLACVSAHKDASFTEIKSVLQSLLKTDSNLDSMTKTAEDPMFAKGKTAHVIIADKRVGTIGQIDSQVIENFKVRVPVCGFEIVLSEFI